MKMKASEQLQFLAKPQRRQDAKKTKKLFLCVFASLRLGETRCLAYSFLLRSCAVSLCVALYLLLAGCGAKGGEPDAKEGAPPPVQVEQEPNADLVKVDKPDQFPLATAATRSVAPELKVTGVVNVDVSRNVPVISLASGRVVEIRAKLGDSVTKGQLLMRVQSSDISGAFSDYRHAVADDVLAHAQLDRAQLLFDKGAIAKKDVEVAQDAEAKAKVDVETAQEHLRVLGADMNHPTATVDITAPISGVIVEQNVTNAGGVKTLDNSPNLFTIADLSSVWIMCDVYENDLANVHMGEQADIKLNAYPDRVFKGLIDNIGPILDPNLRTAKVRLQVQNPGTMRLGMFVTATFHGQTKQVRAVVPATAVLHLHDRDWVYVPNGGNTFRRVGVVGGAMVPPNLQEVTGINPGDRVVANALVLQNTAEQ
ncbi:Efflux transporter, RND family, MFP subunit [Candidatus Sulfopaludibacter sp. SbA3]|nr:Efflux transporter, RND family, MFP subunit [Candidatus Sulfopaludibacter sp. SbA3]